MKYQEEIEIPRSQRIVTHEISRCIKCGCDDLKLHEYEDKYGFISSITCKKCKQIVEEKTGLVYVIGQWNSKNDISLVLEAKSRLVDKTRQEIKELKTLQRERLKEEKKLKKQSTQP